MKEYLDARRARPRLLRLDGAHEPRPDPRRRERGLGPGGARHLDRELLARRRAADASSAIGGAWINPGIEDAVFATLRYPNDVLVNLHASWLNPRKARDITVVGERRMLTFDDMNLHEPIRIYDKQVDRRRDARRLRRHLRVASAPACARATSRSRGSRRASRCGRVRPLPRLHRRPARAPLTDGADGARGGARARGDAALDARAGGREERGASGERDPARRSARPSTARSPTRSRPASRASSTGRRSSSATEVAAFERDVRRVLRRRATASASPTAPTRSSSRCAPLGVGAGDEVILPANTFIATALAVVRAGADAGARRLRPDYAADRPRRRSRRDRRRGRAPIIPVHLYGQMAPMEALAALAARAGVAVVEDAAQAQGARQQRHARRRRRRRGGDELLPGQEPRRLRRRRRGADRRRRARRAACARSATTAASVKYEHPEARLQLAARHAPGRRAARQARSASPPGTRRGARRPRATTSCSPTSPACALPATLPGNEHVWHLYVVRVPRRDARARAPQRGRHRRRHPLPGRRSTCRARSRTSATRAGDFPVAERRAGEILSLPLYPEITPAQQERVVGRARGGARGDAIARPVGLRPRRRRSARATTSARARASGRSPT